MPVQHRKTCTGLLSYSRLWKVDCNYQLPFRSLHHPVELSSSNLADIAMKHGAFDRIGTRIGAMLHSQLIYQMARILCWVCKGIISLQ